MIYILAILAVAYIVLKVYNTRDEFRRRDAAREAREAEEAAAKEAGEDSGSEESDEDGFKLTAADIQAWDEEEDGKEN